MAAADPLPLLLSPRDTLLVLDYVARTPAPHPPTAIRALSTSLHTWYASLERLERLHLIVIERVPGGRKVRGVTLTTEGHSALALLEGLRAITRNSHAAIEHTLAVAPPPRGSPQAGELLLQMVEIAERRGDFETLARVEQLAAAFRRPGEAEFALGVVQFTRGARAQGARHFQAALTHLKDQGTGRSYRRALFYHANAIQNVDDGREAFMELTRLRKLSQDADDLASEADARLGIAIMKALSGHFKDARAHLEKALDCARRAHLPNKECKILTSLCLTELCIDERDGLATSQRALDIALQGGFKLMLVHIRNNRALIFALQGRKKEALFEMREGRRLAAETGYERGPKARDDWDALVRRLVRRLPKGAPIDWRAEIRAMMRKDSVEADGGSRANAGPANQSARRAPRARHG